VVGCTDPDVLDAQVLLARLLDHCVQLGVAGLGLPRPRAAVAEHLLDFLDRLAAGFGVAARYMSVKKDSACGCNGCTQGHSRKEDLDGGAHAKNAKDYKQLPLDVRKARGHEEAQRKVKQPVADSSDAL